MILLIKLLRVNKSEEDSRPLLLVKCVFYKCQEEETPVFFLPFRWTLFKTRFRLSYTQNQTVGGPGRMVDTEQ